MTPGEFRLRVCYRKAGRLRWLSHLEVVHSLERMIRRARLPFSVTQGFSPHLKAAFGPALPVGTASEREYLDVWLRGYTDARRLVDRLVEVAPADLAPSEAAFVSDGAPSLTSALTIGLYSVEIVGREIGPEDVQVALSQVVSAGELAVEHKGKHKVFDLTRAVPKEVRVSDREGGALIELAVRMGPEGSLRPEVLVRAATEATGIEISAVHTTRLDTLVEDDEGVWARPL